MRAPTRIFLTAAALFLAGCTTSEEPPVASDVSGARAGVFLTQQLLAIGRLNPETPRPSALIGVYVSGFLARTPSFLFHSALAGIGVQMSLLYEDEQFPSESFALLEELGITLQVDIADMLNRSTNRSRALSTYVESLAEVLERAALHLTQLDQQQETVVDERRAKREIVVDTQRALDTALREEDYSTASAKQALIIAARGDLAEVETRERELRSTIQLIEDLQEVGQERLLAIEENREILIAGLMVVEVPGIDELGLIKDGPGRRESSNGGGFFGPTGR